MEGIPIFQIKELIPLLDIKVFIDARANTRFKRRSNRDIMERGRTLESVKYQWDSTAEPSRHLYIDTVKPLADLVIRNGGSKGIAKQARQLIKQIDKKLK